MCLEPCDHNYRRALEFPLVRLSCDSPPLVPVICGTKCVQELLGTIHVRILIIINQVFSIFVGFWWEATLR